MEKKPVSYFLVGIVLGMVSIVLFLVYYFMGLTFERNFLTYIPLLAYVLILIYFVVNYSNALEHNVTFGGLFGYGFRATIIWTLISFFFMLLVIYVIFPEIHEKAIENMTLQMDKDPKVSDAQKDTAIKFMDKGFNMILLAGGLFGNLITGAVGALLGAAIAKKNPTTPFNQPA